MTRHVGLPETIQVEETFSQTFGGRHVGTVTAIREGVAAAQTQPVTEVLVQLRICRQTGLVPAERGYGRGVRGWRKGRKSEWLQSDTNRSTEKDVERKTKMGNEEHFGSENQEWKVEITEIIK